MSAVRRLAAAATLVRQWGGWAMPGPDLTGPEILDIVDFLTAADAGRVGDDLLATARAPTARGACMRGAGHGGHPGGHPGPQGRRGHFGGHCGG